MLIGLDARTIYRPTRRGTGKNLIDLYRHLAVVRPDWQVIAYHRQPGRLQRLMPKRVFQPRLIEIVGDRFDAWPRLRLPAAAWRDGVDLLHCPSNACSSWMPVPTVVTIHDLIPLDIPDGQPTIGVRRFEQSVRTACRQAAWIICPSHYTARRLVGEFGADPQRMTVNAWAPDSSVCSVPCADWSRVLQRYNVRGSFVLHFGSGEPRKNTRRVIEAWAVCDRVVRHQRQLLVVGLDDRTREALARSAKQLGVGSSVRLHGFADEADLPTLLSAAEVLVYPSLSEGFGLPILDAWAAGTAVLTSNATSLPEVVGDAAMLVDPLDGCSIARGLHRLLGDRTLRSELLARSQRRLTRYSWHATAQRFAEALEQAVDARGVLRSAA